MSRLFWKCSSSKETSGRVDPSPLPPLSPSPRTSLPARPTSSRQPLSRLLRGRHLSRCLNLWRKRSSSHRPTRPTRWAWKPQPSSPRPRFRRSDRLLASSSRRLVSPRFSAAHPGADLSTNLSPNPVLETRLLASLQTRSFSPASEISSQGRNNDPGQALLLDSCRPISPRPIHTPTCQRDHLPEDGCQLTFPAEEPISTLCTGQEAPPRPHSRCVLLNHNLD